MSVHEDRKGIGGTKKIGHLQWYSDKLKLHQQMPENPEGI